MRWTRRLLAVLALVWAALTGALWLGQDALLYPGWAGASPPLGAYRTPGARPVELRTEDGLALGGWYRPGRPTFVVFHGNGGHDARKLRAFAEEGWGTLIVPHRGFSGQPGRPSEAALVADGRAVLAYARGPLGVPPEEIVLYGESLGSGVAVRLGAEAEVGAVVLEAPFASVEDRAAALYPFVPVRRLLRDRWRSIDHVGRLRAPLLVLHGTADPVMPVAEGRRLLAAAPEGAQGVFIEGAGHQVPPAEAVRAIRAFLGPLRVL